MFWFDAISNRLAPFPSDDDDVNWFFFIFFSTRCVGMIMDWMENVYRKKLTNRGEPNHPRKNGSNNVSDTEIKIFCWAEVSLTIVTPS